MRSGSPPADFVNASWVLSTMKFTGDPSALHNVRNPLTTWGLTSLLLPLVLPACVRLVCLRQQRQGLERGNRGSAAHAKRPRARSLFGGMGSFRQQADHWLCRHNGKTHTKPEPDVFCVIARNYNVSSILRRDTSLFWDGCNLVQYGGALP